jgi:hypothetical protein
LITIEWRGINNIHYTLIGCGEKKLARPSKAIIIELRLPSASELR